MTVTSDIRGANSPGAPVPSWKERPLGEERPRATLAGVFLPGRAVWAVYQQRRAAWMRGDRPQLHQPVSPALGPPSVLSGAVPSAQTVNWPPWAGFMCCKPSQPACFVMLEITLKSPLLLL